MHEIGCFPNANALHIVLCIIQYIALHAELSTHLCMESHASHRNGAFIFVLFGNEMKSDEKKRDLCL